MSSPQLIPGSSLLGHGPGTPGEGSVGEAGVHRVPLSVGLVLKELSVAWDMGSSPTSPGGPGEMLQRQEEAREVQRSPHSPWQAAPHRFPEPRWALGRVRVLLPSRAGGGWDTCNALSWRVGKDRSWARELDLGSTALELKVQSQGCSGEAVQWVWHRDRGARKAWAQAHLERREAVAQLELKANANLQLHLRQGAEPGGGDPRDTTGREKEVGKGGVVCEVTCRGPGPWRDGQEGESGRMLLRLSPLCFPPCAG